MVKILLLRITKASFRSPCCTFGSGKLAHISRNAPRRVSPVVAPGSSFSVAKTEFLRTFPHPFFYLCMLEPHFASEDHPQCTPAAAQPCPKAVPEQQHTQGSGRGFGMQTRPAAAAARASSRVGVRVRTAVNTPLCCAGVRGPSGVAGERGGRSERESTSGGRGSAC